MRGEASRPPILSLHPDSNMLETQQRNNEHSQGPQCQRDGPQSSNPLAQNRAGGPAEAQRLAEPRSLGMVRTSESPAQPT